MRLRDFSLDLAAPLETAEGEISSRRGVLVGVEGGDGGSDSDAGEDDGPARGVGEATPLPGRTESLEACRDALGTHADDEAGEALAALDGDDFPAARHGVSLAVLDGAARDAGESLAARLADRESAVAERVATTATIGDGTPSEAVAAAEQAADAGSECLTLEAGLGALSVDLQRVRAVRDAVGDGVTLRVDAHGSWTPAVAERAIESLSSLDVASVEQPVPPADLAAMADLRGRGVGLAADEAMAEHGLESVLDADAADVVVLKPMALGGVDRAREAARAARRAGVDVVVATTIDGAVARAGAVHLAASIPDVLPCALATGESLVADFVDDPSPIENGAVAVPDGPGIAGAALEGLVWDDAGNAAGP